jgi:DNA (cytosine-5)-methyltransferase 1
MERIAPSGTTARIKAIDLFAGTGWGVACQRLGIKEAGVEIMPEAVATREANGMETIYRDVWDGLQLTAEQHRDAYGSFGLSIASPPCQTFSPAGNGAGRKALNDVLEAIQLHAYKDVDALRVFGEKHDPRTALVLTPLAYVWRDRPKLVAWEQVPTVLPVWQACAEVMRGWGYEVKVEILNAEQYGVPQTRKRAILVARRGGEVHLPIPTHSRYYSSNPSKLDPGVRKWVSMGEALGLTGFTAEKVMGKGMVERYGSRPGRDSEAPAFAIRASAGGMEPGGFVLRSNYGTGGDPTKRGERTIDQPCATLTSKADRMKWDGTRRLAAYEAAALQTYPPGFTWTGKTFLQIGNAVPPLMAEAILAALIGLKPGR